MQGIKGFIGIGEYKKGNLVKIVVLLLEIHIGRGAQHKSFLRYLSISIEIRGII
jgi:hypothetical protein